MTTAAAILVRCWFPLAWNEQQDAASVFYQGDTRAFLAYASHLVAGVPFDNGVPFHPPGWPFVLSLFFRAMGFAPLDGRAADPALVKLFVATIGGLTVGLTTVLAARVAGTGAMLAAAMLGIFHFGHVVQGGVPTSEPLYGLLVVLVLLLTARTIRTGSVGARECSSPSRPHNVSRGARGDRRDDQPLRAPRALRATAAAIRHAGAPAMLGLLGGLTTLVRAEFLVAAFVLGFLHWRSARSVSEKREHAPSRPASPAKTSMIRSMTARVARLLGARSPLLGRAPRRTGSACLAEAHASRARRRACLAGVAYVVGFCVALAPTTVWHWRNLSAFNDTRAGRIAGPLPRFAPVTSYGAFNFAMANHADADGGPNRDHPLLVAESPSDDSIPSEAGLDFASPAVYDLYVHGYQIGLRWLLDNPGEGLALVWRKAVMTSGVFAYGYLQDDIPAGVDGTRRRVDQIDPLRRVLWPIHVGLVLAGAWRVRRLGDDALLLAAPLLALASSSLMFFGYVRLGVAYLPIFWVLQGTALCAVVSRVTVSDTWRRRIPALVLLAAVLLLGVEAVGTRRPRLVTLDGPRDSAGAIVQDETLELRRVR